MKQLNLYEYILNINGGGGNLIIVAEGKKEANKIAAGVNKFLCEGFYVFYKRLKGKYIGKAGQLTGFTYAE